MAYRSGAFAVGLAALALSGCTALGGGHSTIVLGDIAGQPSYPGAEFQGLVRTGPGPAVVPSDDDPDPASAEARWATYKASHPGTEQSAQLDLSVRDLNVTPALDQLNIESTNAGDVAKIMSDSTTTLDQKNQLVAGLRNNYRKMPESYIPMVGQPPRHWAEQAANLWGYDPDTGQRICLQP